MMRRLDYFEAILTESRQYPELAQLMGDLKVGGGRPVRGAPEAHPAPPRRPQVPGEDPGLQGRGLPDHPELPRPQGAHEHLPDDQGGGEGEGNSFTGDGEKESPGPPQGGRHREGGRLRVHAQRVNCRSSMNPATDRMNMRHSPLKRDKHNSHLTFSLPEDYGLLFKVCEGAPGGGKLLPKMWACQRGRFVKRLMRSIAPINRPPTALTNIAVLYGFPVISFSRTIRVIGVSVTAVHRTS